MLTKLINGGIINQILSNRKNDMSNRTPAHNKADKKYAEKITTFTVKFKKTDDLDMQRLAWLNKHQDRTALIKQLIDEKMKENT